MKNSLKNLMLWQKKRDSMKIDADPQTDWLKMQSLLDVHMPVTNSTVPGKLHAAKGLKLWSGLFLGFSAAAMIYFVSNTYKNHHSSKQKPGYHQSPNKPIAGDSAVSGFKPEELAADKKGNIESDTILKNQHSLSQDSSKGAGSITGKNKTVFPSVSNSNSAKNAPGQPVNRLVASLGSPNKNAIPAASITVASKLPDRSAVAGRKGNGVGVVVNKNIYSRDTAQHTAIQQTKTEEVPADRRSQLSGHDQSAILNSENNGSANWQQVSSGGESGHSKSPDLIEVKPITFDLMTPFIARLSVASTAIRNFNLEKPTSLIKTGGEKDKQQKTKVSKPSTPSRFDFGILTGVNSAGSFSPKTKNSNFYGSLAPDLFFGLSAKYNFNDAWAFNTQVHFLSPQNISGSYYHANGSKVDSNQVLKITDSRKFYSIDLPLLAVYKTSGNFSFKAGPIFTIPVKQVNGSTQLLPATIKNDSAYYASTIAQLNGTKYQQKITYGFLGGVSYQINRFSFDAAYIQNLGGYQVNSGFGNYKAHNGTFQFSIGFQLNKRKP